ncbi:MAG: alpha/beta hydrolase [Candidatus Sumerlaeota bacterium]|nr:alpha/beta hydrolase [Candidatus Sumerlaeota bacterium]
MTFKLSMWVWRGLLPALIILSGATRGTAEPSASSRPAAKVQDAAVAAPASKPLADNQKPRKYERQPDLANVPYGPYERDVFDLWKAKSDRPTPLVFHFHSGGFTQGDKSWISAPLVEICLEKGISVATANYRYSTQDPYPAQLHDCARAVQFLRYHAKDYNLDPKALAITGGSAGGVISMWLGFFDDMADPTNADPVLRESTRPAVIGPVDGQTTLDPRVGATFLGADTVRWVAGPAFPLFRIRRDEDLFTCERAFPLYEEASPVNHLKAGAPPVIMYYIHPPGPLPPATKDEGLHNIRFGYFLKERMDKLGIECVLHHSGEYKGQGPEGHLRVMVEFYLKHFPHEAP